MIDRKRKKSAIKEAFALTLLTNWIDLYWRKKKKVDILIKSFNRPYYLDRCLRSIERFVTGSYSIKVLDDGTPAVYLEKIKDKYPDIQIEKSNYYEAKSQALMDHVLGAKKYDLKPIPTQFWRETVAEATDYFLLMEEDAWLTGHIDIDSLSSLITQQSIMHLKFFWDGNQHLIGGTRSRLNKDIVEIDPCLPKWDFLIDPIVQNTFKLRSALFKSGMLSYHYFLPYYALYTVSSAIFKKSYWLNIWNDSPEKVNEFKQLQEAYRWNLLHPNSRHARFESQIVKASLITSSFNTYRSLPLDMIQLNYNLNEHWRNGRLDSMTNFPNDFTETYIGQFLENSAVVSFSLWKDWIAANKHGLQSIGSATT